MVFLERCHCGDYDQKHVEKKEKIPIVFLPRGENMIKLKKTGSSLVHLLKGEYKA